MHPALEMAICISCKTLYLAAIDNYMYNPGLHIISTLNSKDIASLSKYESLQQLLDKLIADNGLQKLGEVYHNFSPAGFTLVVCLSESHISIHTWPEYQKVNLDIYLSNYKHQNDEKGKAIYKALQEYFSANIHHEQIISR